MPLATILTYLSKTLKNRKSLLWLEMSAFSQAETSEERLNVKAVLIKLLQLKFIEYTFHKIRLHMKHPLK